MKENEKPMMNQTNSSCCMMEEATLASFGFDQSKLGVSTKETDKYKTENKEDKNGKRI